MPLEVACVPALADNYIWLLHDPTSGETVAVDPGEAAPVEQTLARRDWRLSAIWTTHWHGDHTGGNAALKAAHGVPVYAPAAEAGRIPTADHLLREGDRVTIGEHVATVWATPGHTAGHIGYHLADTAMIFVGDTLFAMGSGRLFEGSAGQMAANLARLAALPPETRVYGAHEYTESNGRFALHVDADNVAVRERMAMVTAARGAGEPTLPTTIALERATNPFMRAANADDFARLRAEKDDFRV